MTLTDTTLAEIEAAARAATEGPWQIDNFARKSEDGIGKFWSPEIFVGAGAIAYLADDAYVEIMDEPPSGPDDPGCSFDIQGQRNARFITLACNNAAAMVKEIRALRERVAVLERLAPEHFRWTGGPDQTEDPEWACDKLKYGGAHFENIGTPEVRLVVFDNEDRRWVAKPGDYIVRHGNGLTVLPATQKGTSDV